MELDGSDILGQDTMPNIQATRFYDPRDGRSLFSVPRVILVLLVISSGYAVGTRLWRRFLLWRERSYKLATRRRHGIPDDDLRPFNVAYTDAVMRTREEGQKKQPNSGPVVQHSPVNGTSATQVEALSVHNLRQRPVTDPSLRSAMVGLPGGYASQSTEAILSSAPRSGDDRISRNNFPSISHVQQSSTSGANKRNERPLLYSERDNSKSESEVRKRSRLAEQNEEHEAKKTRVEGEELIDGDEDAEFEEGAPRRGSKRGMQEDADEESEGGTQARSRGKRARKVSSEKTFQADQYMDIDDEDMDDVAELKPLVRGIKRDRAEAGSTFGGDDDESELEDEVDGDHRLRRRRRKRRTVAKRKSEATYLRGKKREREVEDVSDDNSDEASKSIVSPSRRKRGRRSNVHEIDRQKGDVSMDESVTSSKRLREIGEEWESNGVRYKVGPNGQRLRQALVKKARQKFVMPKDSQHPDRDVNMQVCLECWLTEEEYQQAKNDHLLAWQDSPKHSEDADFSFDLFSQSVPFPPSVPGKNLLWSASASTTPTMSPSYSPSESQNEVPLPRRVSSFRHSIATSVGLPITPLGSSTSTLTAVKRISTTSRALSLSGSTNTLLASSVNSPDSPATHGLSDSTNASPRTPAPPKVFSKWEKQELEARAILKVREANRKKEMEKEAKEKEVKEARERVEKERAAEKERQEKAKQERERLELEKKEKEKREKEAAAVAASNTSVSTAPGSVPTITVTGPSTGSTAASNSFVNLSTKPAENTSSTGQSTVTVPNFFAKPIQPATGFTVGARTASSSEVPAPTTTAMVSDAPGTKQHPFSLEAPVGGGPEQKKDIFGSKTGPTPAAPAQTPLFSFTKPDAVSLNNTSTISAFPTSAPMTSTGTATATGTAGMSTAPKFSFNFNRPANTTTANTSTSIPTPAVLADKKESTTPVFSFKPSTTTTASSTGATTSGTSGVTAPKYSFGSTFGTSTSGTTPAIKDATGGGLGTTTSPFRGNVNAASPFGTTSGTTSTFGTTAFGTTSSAFTKPSGTSPFNTSGSTVSPFGTQTKPSMLDSSNPFSGTTTKTENKPSFSFRNPPALTSGSSTPGNTTFSFGATPSTSSTTPSTTPASVFPFKAPTTTPQSSPFATTGTGASSTSVFGKTESNNNTAITTTPLGPAPTFNFNSNQQK